MARQIYILMGPPGSGKSTIGGLLSNYLNLPYLGVGDMLRATMASDSDLGKSLAPYLKEGKLAPPKLVHDVVLPALSCKSTPKGFIIDGFPRSRVDADVLWADLQESDDSVSAVVLAHAPTHVLRERLGSRGREDDSKSAISSRLSLYRSVTHPVLSHYSKADVEIHVANTNADPDGVFAQLKKDMRI